MSDEPSDEELRAIEDAAWAAAGYTQEQWEEAGCPQIQPRALYNAGKEAGRASLQRELEEAKRGIETLDTLYAIATEDLAHYQQQLLAANAERDAALAKLREVEINALLWTLGIDETGSLKHASRRSVSDINIRIADLKEACRAKGE